MGWSLDKAVRNLSGCVHQHQRWSTTGEDALYGLPQPKPWEVRDPAPPTLSELVPWLPGVRLLMAALPAVPGLYFSLAPLFDGLDDDLPCPEIPVRAGWTIVEERPSGPWWASLRLIPDRGSLEAMALAHVGIDHHLVRAGMREIWLAVPAELCPVPVQGQATDGQVVCAVDGDGSMIVTAHTWPVLAWGVDQLAYLCEEGAARARDELLRQGVVGVLRDLESCHEFQRAWRGLHKGGGRVASGTYALLRQVPTTTPDPSRAPRPVDALDLDDARDVEQFITESQRLDPYSGHPVTPEEDAAVLTLLRRWIAERSGPPEWDLRSPSRS